MVALAYAAAGFGRCNFGRGRVCFPTAGCCSWLRRRCRRCGDRSSHGLLSVGSSFRVLLLPGAAKFVAFAENGDGVVAAGALGSSVVVVQIAPFGEKVARAPTVGCLSVNGRSYLCRPLCRGVAVGRLCRRPLVEVVTTRGGSVALVGSQSGKHPRSDWCGLSWVMHAVLEPILKDP
ncbi:hypothetical protein KC19_VG310200 [Ceratodon purpureus]|uniref:Uncharacterized protein n=1 Tax=Ceratodon purpureus TaxID=3225 RepID=A0A8T0HVY7_CERPU|nr:hypothetical protein KC19_VG310200 [Ceratodon purpureus]